MKTLSTPAMNEAFSRVVTALASFQRRPSRSTPSRIFRRYLASCSSGPGTRRRHSSITRSRACALLLFSFSCCRRTFSVCADSVCCNFSNRWGKAKLSSTSSTVNRSKGGNPSQSSWYDPLLPPEKYPARLPDSGESRGLVGVERNILGVFKPEDGADPASNGAAPSPAGRDTPGDRRSSCVGRFVFDSGIGMGSDMAFCTSGPGFMAIAGFPHGSVQLGRHLIDAERRPR